MAYVYCRPLVILDISDRLELEALLVLRRGNVAAHIKVPVPRMVQMPATPVLRILEPKQPVRPVANAPEHGVILQGVVPHEGLGVAAIQVTGVAQLDARAEVVGRAGGAGAQDEGGVVDGENLPLLLAVGAVGGAQEDGAVGLDGGFVVAEDGGGADEGEAAARGRYLVPFCLVEVGHDFATED